MPEASSQIRWLLDRPGRGPLDLTPYLVPDRWSTLAVGGFGSLTGKLPGDLARWKREIPHLSVLTGVYGPRVVWQGQVEDLGLQARRGDVSARLQAFGLARKLDRTSVRKQWLTRAPGTWDVVVRDNADVSFEQGQIELSDQTKVGARFSIATGVTMTGPLYTMYARLFAPPGLYWKRIAGTRRSTVNANGNHWLRIVSTVDASDTTIFDVDGTESATAFSGSTSSDVGDYLLYSFQTATGLNYTSGTGDLTEIYGLRLLGWSQTEDTSGAFYGGTILRDLVGLVPGLTVGAIEDGSDFGIQQIEAAVRRSARQVVDEVASYYAREWAVWEDGRFDWKTPTLGEPQWATTLADLDELNLDATVDGLAKTTYVLYTDAARQREAEASAASGDQRNPFVKTGETGDRLVSAGFPMTSASATQLAQKYAGEAGQWPTVRGSITLPADRVVRHAIEGAQPAWAIRAGDNLVVADLPKTDAMTPGRDGDTLFHIVSADVELANRRVVLGIEAQTPRMDQLLARLAAATRAVTG